MLTLVVVPPALHLPSLDAECIAAISYLSSALPQGEWEVAADTHGILAGQAGTWRRLPALWDGDILVNGFERIVSYLKERSNGSWDLDSHLSKKGLARQHGALCTISTKLRPLISLLLYTSSENYVKVTRPALGQMLTFPTSWVLPIHHQENQESVASTLGISAGQLSAAALSLRTKPKKKEPGTMAARAEPLDDDEIARPNRVPEYIPFFGSASATLSVHRQLRELVKDTLAPYSSYAKNEPQFLKSDGKPTSLGCALFGYLSLAIAAAERQSPHPFVTSVLHAEYPELETLVENWMDNTWGFELDGSTAQHARKRRAAMNKGKIQSLPWKQDTTSLMQKSRGFAANWIHATGLSKSWIQLGAFSTRTASHYHDSGAVICHPADDGATQGRGLGHRTDLLVGLTVAISSVVLGYQAWQEGF